MVLMIGNGELARRMYEAWRVHMDMFKPIIDTEPVLSSSGTHRATSYRPISRPRWEHLIPAEQDVWRVVAREVGGVLADTMGAL
jgi:hypothetical protein